MKKPPARTSLTRVFFVVIKIMVLPRNKKVNKVASRLWTSAAQAACAALSLSLILLPLAPALAASYINTAVPSNSNLSSGFVQHQIRFGAGLQPALRSFSEVGINYSFDANKVSTTTVTDESLPAQAGGNAKMT